MHHDRSFDPAYGQAVEIEPGIRRVTVRNPGPFTFFGTNSYIIGQDRVVILDPGPVSPEHQKALLDAVAGQTVAAILVSHTHMDHSPAARPLADHLDVPVIGCGRHRAARPLRDSEINALDASADKIYRPDHPLGDGDRLSDALAQAGLGFDLEVVATPGHTTNHLCFCLAGTEILFSADHVMAWATSIVAPPDGSMADYMASLNRLMLRPETRFLPGHGGVVQDAHPYMQALRDHRLAREAAILETLKSSALAIPQIVDRVYEGLDPALKPAAGLSVFAHIEDLHTRGLVAAADGTLALSGLFRSLQG